MRQELRWKNIKIQKFEPGAEYMMVFPDATEHELATMAQRLSRAHPKVGKIFLTNQHCIVEKK